MATRLIYSIWNCISHNTDLHLQTAAFSIICCRTVPQVSQLCHDPLFISVHDRRAPHLVPSPGFCTFPLFWHSRRLENSTIRRSCQSYFANRIFRLDKMNFDPRVE
ncbi:hypothetical protein PMIN06_010091 [Paraphaeosphaeria minitans]